MQYMCIIYTTEGTGPQPGPDDWGPFMQGYQDFTAKVTQDGKLVHADALQPTQTATTVSMRDGKNAHHRWSVRGNQGAAGRLLPA